MASRIVGAVPDETESALLRRRWTVPILSLTDAPQRFSVLRSGLVTVSDRALSISLHQLEEREWLRRDIDTSERAPHPTYRAVNRGIEINQAIGLSV